MRKIIEIGKELKSNTEYYANQNRYDVYLHDAISIENALYASCCDACRSEENDTTMRIAFILKDKENIVLDFCGATLYLHGMMQPFLLDNCKNITIKNCVIEYDRSFVSEAEVVESTEEYLKVKMFKQFPYRVDDGDLIFTSDTWEYTELDKGPVFFQFFTPDTHQGAGLRLAIVGKNPQLDESLPWASWTLKLRAKAEGEYLVFEGSNLPIFGVGLIMTIAHSSRKYSGLMIVNSENVYLENIRLLNGAGMGLLPMYTKNLYVDGFTLCCDEKSPGIISNEADGIHAIACSGDMVFKNCILEGMIDDALNIHSNFHQVISCDGNKLISTCAGAVAREYMIFGENDTIAIYQGSTLVKSAEYIIKSIRRLEDVKVEITVDRPLLNHNEGDVIENLSAQAKVTISNCRFGKANTHLRFQSRGGILIENSETELPFWLTGDMSYWFESSPVDNLVIRNTKFKTRDAVVSITPEFMPTEEAPYYHGNIIIEECEFASEQPVFASYTKSIRFSRNTTLAGNEMTLELKNCGACEAEGCNLVRKIEKKDSLSVN